MDFIEKLLLGGAGTAVLGVLLERARRYWMRSDNRQEAEDERERKADQFDSLFSGAKRWRKKALLCVEIHRKTPAPDPTLDYALNDLCNELDLSEWEPKPDVETT